MSSNSLDLDGRRATVSCTYRILCSFRRAANSVEESPSCAQSAIERKHAPTAADPRGVVVGDGECSDGVRRVDVLHWALVQGRPEGYQCRELHDVSGRVRAPLGDWTMENEECQITDYNAIMAREFTNTSYIVQESLDVDCESVLDVYAYIATGTCELAIMYVEDWGFRTYRIAQREGNGSIRPILQRQRVSRVLERDPASHYCSDEGHCCGPSARRVE